MRNSWGLAFLRLAAVAASAVVSFSVHAEEEGFVEPPSKPLAPATRYSGKTPVDLKNGLLFNNGTFGKRNPSYEKWADEPALVPDVSSLSYPFNEKDDLVRNLEESARFVADAIENWKTTSSITKPEAKAYGEQSAATMQPLLERFQAAIKNCSTSGAADWDKNQADAKRELVAMRSTYSSLHKNVH